MSVTVDDSTCIVVPSCQPPYLSKVIYIIIYYICLYLYDFMYMYMYVSATLHD